MIGTRIRRARIAKNLSMREVGEVLNVTPQAVANWEKTSPRFSRNKAIELSNVLGANLDWLDGLVGTDEEVIASDAETTFGGRVPIINRSHAVLFSLFNRTNFDEFKHNETLEPTISIKGQGFAIRINAEDAIGVYSEGNIAIFDNGISPQKGDRVIAIYIDGDQIQTIFAKILFVEGDGSASKQRYLVSEIEEETKAVATATGGGATPIAVLVELRRLRRPDPKPEF